MMVESCLTKVTERDAALSKCQSVLEFEERLWGNSRARLEAELVGALPPPGSPAMAQAPVGPRAIDGPDVPFGGGLTTEVLSHSSRASHSDLAHARDEGVLKQGFLFPIQSFALTWTRKRRWYRLYNGNLYYIPSTENLDPQFCCDIRTCTVHARSPDDDAQGDGYPYCFIVLQVNGTNLKFQAENEDELFKWISAIRRCQSKWRLSSRAGLGPGAEVADKANASLLERMLEANPLCAECGAGEVEWVSTSLGVTLCPDCAIR